MDKLEFRIDSYYASEVDPDAIMVSTIRQKQIQHIGDVTRIDMAKVNDTSYISLTDLKQCVKGNVGSAFRDRRLWW